MTQLIKRKRRYKRQFRIEYFVWGSRIRWQCGFSDDLAECYGLASRHLGRGSVYWRAVIYDNDTEKAIARLSRYMNQIKIEEF
jgi:hypothetical protein